MSNICVTEIHIFPKKQGEAERVGALFRKWLDNAYNVEFKDSSWLGSFAMCAGLDPDNYSTRGYVSDILFDENEVTVFVDDDWSPNLQVWVAICNSLLGNGQWEIVFTAEEPGFSLFQTNDAGLVSTFHWDNHGNVPEIYELVGDDNYSVSREETAEYLRKLLPNVSCDATLKDLLQIYEEKKEFSERCTISEWEERDITELA